MKPEVKAFFDPQTYTLTYVVWDPDSQDAVVIDPVHDYDPLAVRVSDESVKAVSQFIKDKKLELHWVLETHAHADHLSGAPLLKEAFGAGIVIGKDITKVQETFKSIFNMKDLATDGSQFDRLLSDEEILKAGTLAIEAIHTPGHTPACMSYRIGDAVFTGDALFMEDFGTGRCDFPAGSVEQLYNSVVNKLYVLPGETRVFVGHDYQPGGRKLAYETTIARSREQNKQLRSTTTKEEFIKFRTERDKTLRPPLLIFQSVQVNVNAGRLPEAEDNGRRYLKLPLNLLE